jgi:hypothetical protein
MFLKIGVEEWNGKERGNGILCRVSEGSERSRYYV